MNVGDTAEEMKLALLEKFYQDRPSAHEFLFPMRKKNRSPEFHVDILTLLYSTAQWVLVEAFRGGAKSTLIEEYTILDLLFKDSRFAIIIGNTYDRACERLATIKHELETNDEIIELFGPQVGPIWSADVIVLANGARVQAFGARQSLRGAKTKQGDRPDLAVVDDLEDEDNIATEAARAKTRRWFDGSLIPALTPTGKVRMVGTPLHPKSLLEEKRNSRQWSSIVIPISYFNADGTETSSWPDRFSIEWIRARKQSFVEHGAITEYEQEYMCRAEDQATKPFKVDMFRSGTLPIGFHSVEIMVDPARTVNNKTSARTGYAAWSWIGNTLYVHEAYGKFHRPDEIINEIFVMAEKYNPVTLGVEADGLEEFIMQPLRDEQVKRGVSIPLSPQRAPKDKSGFISGLQPFYIANSVVHVGDCKDLESELKNFPTGRCDVPNSLAYSLKMRVGKPVYEEFGQQHIVERMEVSRNSMRYLAVSATPSMTAAAIMQFRDGNIYVTHDWVKNEPAQEALAVIFQEARLLAGDFTVISPTEQFDKYTNNGIPAALKQAGQKFLRGHIASQSIGCMAERLKHTNKGRPAFQVSTTAKWVCNAMARGYARKLLPTGSYADFPEKNQYSLVMEAIESFASYIKRGKIEGDDELTRAMTAGGRSYYSALPQRE
jgi:hypothetical protein